MASGASWSQVQSSMEPKYPRVWYCRRWGEHAMQSGHCKAGLPLVCAALYLYLSLSVFRTISPFFCCKQTALCVLYTTQYYLLKCFVGLDQVVSRWCCGLFRFIIIIIIPCHEYVPQNTVLCSFFPVGLWWYVIPYLDIRADHQICLISLLNSVNSSPPLSPVNEDRNPVHWAFIFTKF